MPHPKRKAQRIPDIVDRQQNASVPNQTAATKYKHVKPKRETKNDDGQDNENPTNTTQNIVMEHKKTTRNKSKTTKGKNEHIRTNCQFNIIGQKGKQSKPQAMSGCASHAFCL